MQRTVPIRYLALVGLGWHARRVYYPWIEQAVQAGQLELSAVVDLHENQAVIRDFLSRQAVQPGLLLLTEAADDADHLPHALTQALTALLQAGRLDGMIVSTDPRAHKAYVLWALAHGVHILLDKPISAPKQALTAGAVADVLEADFEVIARAAQQSTARLVVQAQRRVHPGYRFVRDTVSQLIAQHRIPITFLDLYHADGMWVMPWEFDRDHHPYKYGTGKLLHSGYHFVDLCVWMLGLNALAFPDPDSSTLEYHLMSYDPVDALALMAGKYRTLFALEQEPGPISPVDGYGELDLVMQGQLRRRDRVQTTISLQLLQNSFSRRSVHTPAQDPYKGAGRVRHERLNLHVGPLLNVQVHSYQSTEVGDPRQPLEYGPGHLHHFEVSVFRNAELVGGVPFEQYSFGQASEARGHNELARQTLLSAFVSGQPTGSELESHRQTTRWLAQLYRTLQQRREGGPGIGRMPSDDGTMPTTMPQR